MNDDQCRQKFIKCIDYSGLAIKDEAREELFSMVDNLESLTDVQDLVRIMAG